MGIVASVASRPPIVVQVFFMVIEIGNIAFAQHVGIVIVALEADFGA